MMIKVIRFIIFPLGLTSASNNGPMELALTSLLNAFIKSDENCLLLNMLPKFHSSFKGYPTLNYDENSVNIDVDNVINAESPCSVLLYAGNESTHFHYKTSMFV